jgi:hypothetical protein
VNHLRLIAAILIGITPRACDVFAQQANIPNASSQQVDPTVLDLPITGSTVSDIHLRPLFTTTIRLSIRSDIRGIAVSTVGGI